MEDNPFSRLFNSKEEFESASQAAEKKHQDVSNMLSRIFLLKSELLIPSSNTPKYVVSLPTFGLSEKAAITMDNYEKALAERLQMPSPGDHLVLMSKGIGHGLFGREKAEERSKVIYLFNCYSRAMAERTENDSTRSKLLTAIKEKITTMAGVMACTLHNMLVLQRQNSSKSDFVNLLISSISGTGSFTSLEFFKGVASSQTQSNLMVIFNPFLDRAYSMTEKLSLSSPDLQLTLDIVQFICQTPQLAKLLVDSIYWLPVMSTPRGGKSFEVHTFLGRILRPTSLAPSPMQPAEHFADLEPPLRIDLVNSITDSVRSQLEGVVSRLHLIISSLLRQGEYVRDRFIRWLVECFSANLDRGKMLSRLQGAGPYLTTASDGFFLNLSWVLLLLSTPFAKLDTEGINPRLRNIDPGYCVILNRKGSTQRDDETNVETLRGLVVDFSQETKLAHIEETGGLTSLAPPPPVLPIKFITHCFYLTHKCLILGLTQTIHLFNDTRRMYSRLHHMGGAVPHMQMLQSQILGIKAHAMDPLLLELCLTFYTATSLWFVELVKGDRPNLFPLPQHTPVRLRSIPECLVENLADFAMFLRESGSDILDTADIQQKHLLIFCTVFMGSSSLLHNPHLRAKLAQLVSMMIPRQDDEDRPRGLGFSAFLDSQRMLFESCKISCDHLLESLLMIFIDIEHTGDSMEFEDKFQYRMPMYDILKFLWSSPAYDSSIKRLADEAVAGGDSMVTTLFLRFINVMINDAILQLDEGLQNLTVIREVEILKDSDEWEELTEEQKKEKNDKLDEATMYASNRNMLARKTVNSLEIITKNVTKPFVTITMIDRMPAMLNYFLKKLVGPSSIEYNVKEKEKYNFDPQELVCGIISVYINLGREEEFCKAVHRDERSFKMELFDKALSLLRRLGMPNEMCVGLVRVRERVKQYTHQQELEDLLTENAPEQFLDPMMGTIMWDPVHLPTSGMVVDRSTIVRHLLSEQIDPFNRAPLTPEMLQPMDSLREQIQEWKKAQIRSNDQ